VTPGQASDMTAYDDLMAEDAPLPEAMLGEKGTTATPSGSTSNSAASIR